MDVFEGLRAIGLEPVKHTLGAEAQTLLMTLYADVPHGTTVALAGGAVRDIVNGRRPNDYDVLVIPDQTYGSPNASAVAFTMYRRCGWLITAEHVNYDGRLPEELQDRNLSQVVTLTAPVAGGKRKVDLLQYDVGSLAAALLEFDFNLNQYVAFWHWPNENVGPELHIWGPADHTLRQLRDSHVQPERIQRMRELATEYGWTV